MSVSFCGECGSRIDLDASYCSECGWKVIDDYEDEIVKETDSIDRNNEKNISNPVENAQNHQSQIPHTVINQTANAQQYQAPNYNQDNYNHQYHQTNCNQQYNQGYNQQGYNQQYDVQNQFNQFSNNFGGNDVSRKSKKVPIILASLIVAGLLITGIAAMFLFDGSESDKNMAFREGEASKTSIDKKSIENQKSIEKVGNIVQDVTFDRLQGDWNGTCTLVELKNIEDAPDIPREYIQKIKDLLNVENTCALEVDESDLELDINVEEGMSLEFQDCSLAEGMITFEMAEEKGGITMALQTISYVHDEDGQLTIRGNIIMKVGKAELVYNYSVTR